jgi:Histidine phosphatase superfamily (branch 1)
MLVSVSCTRVLGRGSQSQKWLADGRSSGRCGVRRLRRSTLTGERRSQRSMPGVADAFEDLVRSSDTATVAVFTHDAVVRAAVAWTLRVGPATYRHIDVANCSITTIHASTSVRRLVALNDTSHLLGSER